MYIYIYINQSICNITLASHLPVAMASALVAGSNVRDVYLHPEQYDSKRTIARLHTDDKTRQQMDAEKKATIDKVVAEFQKVQKAYNDSTTRLAEAEAHGKEAHDGYVKYKAAVNELQKEEAKLESRLSTVDADSAKTHFELSVLKNFLEKMQHANETGAQDTYSARLMSAMNTEDRLITSDQNKNALRTALRSLAKPKELTVDIVKTVEAEAKDGAEGLKNRVAKVKEALANATQMHKGYRMDYVTFSTDADLQREPKRAAHAQLAKLDGEQMAATWAYENAGTAAGRGAAGGGGAPQTEPARQLHMGGSGNSGMSAKPWRLSFKPALSVSAFNAPQTIRTIGAGTPQAAPNFRALEGVGNGRGVGLRGAPAMTDQHTEVRSRNIGIMGGMVAAFVVVLLMIAMVPAMVPCVFRR
jgi:hypothetical protein